MKGRGKLAGLPELTNKMERSLLAGFIIEHTPESGEWMNADIWVGFIRRDLELLDQTVASYWHYSQLDGREILDEIKRLEGAGYIETQFADGNHRDPLYIRRTGRANAWLNRLHAKTREWVSFFGALDLLDKLAGL